MYIFSISAFICFFHCICHFHTHACVCVYICMCMHAAYVGLCQLNCYIHMHICTPRACYFRLPRCRLADLPTCRHADLLALCAYLTCLLARGFCGRRVCMCSFVSGCWHIHAHITIHACSSRLQLYILYVRAHRAYSDTSSLFALALSFSPPAPYALLPFVIIFGFSLSSLGLTLSAHCSAQQN